MTFRFDEQLNAGSFHRARRIGDESSEVEGLNVESFEMVENGGTDETLTRSWFSENKESRSEDAKSLERYRREISVGFKNRGMQKWRLLTLEHLFLFKPSSIIYELGFF